MNLQKKFKEETGESAYDLVYLKYKEYYVEWLEEQVEQLDWVAIEDYKPADCESLIGIEMPYEARYACHREDNFYVSDETGESVVITHWMYAPDPPCA